MDYAEYRRYDAVGLAELLASGQVLATELLDAALARADSVNPQVNAIVADMSQIARERATRELSGPFAGVPFLVKDLTMHYRGLPTGSGSRSLARVPVPVHADVVQRWLDAGLVIFGKTNTPEFGAKGVTEPEVNGPTRNPWNLAYTPGGSSGGAAAAVAAGMVPVAGASDGGGSIRIPAACCGLFGLKPSRGLVPSGPDAAERLLGASVTNVISRSVRDSAAMLDVLAGNDPGGPYLAAQSATPYRDLAARPPAPLRIGFSVTSPLGTPVSPEAVTAVTEAAALLESLGHVVEPAETGVDERQLAQDFLRMWFANEAAVVAEVKELTGCGDEGFEDDTLLMAALGARMKAADYIRTHDRWNTYNRTLAAFHARYHLLLTPTLARPPSRIGEAATPAWQAKVGRALRKVRGIGLLSALGVVDRLVEKNLGPVPFTQLANITGRPAMSVPLHWTAGGLPLGVQFVGPLGSEGLLLALATQLETAQPWFDREPPLLPSR